MIHLKEQVQNNSKIAYVLRKNIPNISQNIYEAFGDGLKKRIKMFGKEMSYNAGSAGMFVADKFIKDQRRQTDQNYRTNISQYAGEKYGMRPKTILDILDRDPGGNVAPKDRVLNTNWHEARDMKRKLVTLYNQDSDYKKMVDSSKRKAQFYSDIDTGRGILGDYLTRFRQKGPGWIQQADQLRNQRLSLKTQRKSDARREALSRNEDPNSLFNRVKRSLETIV